ncbi:hypothetical protein [Haloactinomyces albus]|uniref:Uncharacterized protein n=1 Tax=Haloactinomyces albus TaxID=1352928 RepID=A0AAE4CM90_9ACTN|nr:hypothetical protein [Haloactinomyces albus]MDR7300732.1 hypothetical protein [Haloactinomyces albus]
MTNPHGPPGPQQYPQPGAPVPAPQGPPQGPPQGGYPPQGPPVQQGPGAAGAMGQQMAPPPPGMGRIVLDTSYMPLAFLLALFKPGITVNGQPYPVARWGQNVLDLPPGRHQIQVHVNYLWKFGHAQAFVPVDPGRQVDVYYRSPAVAFGEGAIGPVPQSTPNMALTIVLMVASVSFGFLSVILSLTI